MIPYGTFDSDGLPLGFYTDDIHGPRQIMSYRIPEPTDEDPDPLPVEAGLIDNPNCRVPENAIELTIEQWRDFIDNMGTRKWIDGAVVAYDRPEYVVVELTPQQKLAAAGLSVDELKTLLGIK